jgi:hypothetical protein
MNIFSILSISKSFPIPDVNEETKLITENNEDFLLEDNSNLILEFSWLLLENGDNFLTENYSLLLQE